jgi:hypothetical protein
MRLPHSPRALRVHYSTELDSSQPISLCEDGTPSKGSANSGPVIEHMVVETSAKPEGVISESDIEDFLKPDLELRIIDNSESGDLLRRPASPTQLDLPKGGPKTHSTETEQAAQQEASPPLVAPVVTPLDWHFNVGEYTVPGAYFSPLSSPDLDAQRDLSPAPKRWASGPNISLHSGSASSAGWAGRHRRQSEAPMTDSTRVQRRSWIGKLKKTEYPYERTASGAVSRGIAVITREVMERRVQQAPDPPGISDYSTVSNRPEAASVGAAKSGSDIDPRPYNLRTRSGGPSFASFSSYTNSSVNAAMHSDHTIVKLSEGTEQKQLWWRAFSQLEQEDHANSIRIASAWIRASEICPATPDDKAAQVQSGTLITWLENLRQNQPAAAANNPSNLVAIDRILQILKVMQDTLKFKPGGFVWACLCSITCVCFPFSLKQRIWLTSITSLSSGRGMRAIGTPISYPGSQMSQLSSLAITSWRACTSNGLA